MLEHTKNTRPRTLLGDPTFGTQYRLPAILSYAHLHIPCEVGKVEDISGEVSMKLEWLLPEITSTRSLQKEKLSTLFRCGDYVNYMCFALLLQPLCFELALKFPIR